MDLQTLFYAVAIVFMVLTASVIVVVGFVIYKVIDRFSQLEQDMHQKIESASQFASKLASGRNIASIALTALPFAWKAIKKIKRK